MQWHDWGTRCPRWTGIHGETVEVGGVASPFLHAPGTGDADAPTHVLAHGLLGGAVHWLDAIAGLHAYGPVIAPDLPGALTGGNASKDADADGCARFLAAFLTALDLQDVVLHGWSTGGLAAVRYTAREPGRVARLVLTSPTLPKPLEGSRARAWRWFGRIGLRMLPPFAKVASTVFGQHVISGRIGGRDDTRRISPELAAAWNVELANTHGRTAGVVNMTTAFASAMTAMYVHQEETWSDLGKVTVPGLVLHGADDRFVPGTVVDAVIARQPTWSRREFPGVRHMLPMERPDAYVTAVGEWLNP